MKVLLRNLLVLVLLAWVASAHGQTYEAVVTDVTALALDRRPGPSAESVWYDNSNTQFALLARTRTPELASPVLYSDIHNVSQFTIVVQNTPLPVGRPYGVVVKLYQGVDDTDSGPAGDPLILADTGPDFLFADDQFAYIITFTVPDSPEWDPNLISFPDGSSATGNWLSVTYQGQASGPAEDNATHTANGPADPLSFYFFSVDDRMMRPWPLPNGGPYGFTLQISD
jgi:hypothetical protein